MIKKICLFVLVAFALSSCVAVQEYEKVYINDADMVLGDKISNRNISTFHAYREAAVGANGGKTGGGCGCN